MLLEGVKYDQDKERYDLIDGYALNELAKSIPTVRKNTKIEIGKRASSGVGYCRNLRHLWKFWVAKQLGLSESDDERPASPGTCGLGCFSA